MGRSVGWWVDGSVVDKSGADGMLVVVNGVV
jgi:hypothetical protein